MTNPSRTGNYPATETLYAQNSGTTSSDPFLTVFQTRDPTNQDINYPIQKRWVNFSTPVKEWILKSYTGTAGTLTANWVLVASGSSVSVESIQVDVAVAPGVNPVAPNGSDVIDFGESFATHTPIATGTNAAGYQTATRALNELGVELQLAGSHASSSTPNNFGIAQFDSNQFNVTSGFVQLVGGVTPPALTLSDNAGTKVSPDGTGNIQLEGQLNEQSGSFATTVSNAGSHLIKINPLSGSRWIVDPLSTAANPNGTHTTIASAISSASSGDTIVLMPGTYTENPTLKAGVNLVAWDADADTPNVIIQGKCTFTGTGTVSISGIQLQTNSDFFLVISGSSNSVVNLINCYLNCLNNTGINYASSGANSGISIQNCMGNLATTGIALFTATGSGSLGTFPAGSGIYLVNTVITNTANSSTANTSSSCQIGMNFCRFFNPFSVTSSGTVNFVDVIIETQNQNITCITTAGTGTHNLELVHLRSGTASAISVGAGTTLQAYSCVINSNNANAITGAGTLAYGDIIYPNTSTINVTTQNPVALTLPQGGTGDSSFTAFSVICGGTTSTGSLQNVSGVGTSGQVLTSNGAGALPSWKTGLSGSFTSINVQVFTSSGTYTPTVGMLYCTIECQGGGGGGAGAGATGAATVATGGGGSAGGYSRKTVSAATIGASQVVTIGSGGGGGSGNANGSNGNTSSVGAIVSCTGGTGGNAGGIFATIAAGGNPGGAGSGGDINITGGAGGPGFGFQPAIVGGFGGNSVFGGGGVSGAIVSGGGGGSGAAAFSGAGGSAGVNSTSQAGTQTGGSGAGGIVIITEFV